MKRLLLLSAMLGFSFINNSLFSSGGIVQPEDYYCGYDEKIQDCTWVLEGSACATNANCKKIEINPVDPDNPIEP